jgi:hypothetical protein
MGRRITLESPELNLVGERTAQPFSPDTDGHFYVSDFFNEAEIIRAQLYCPPGYRLLDVLNRAVDDDFGRNSAFIEVMECGTEKMGCVEGTNKTYIRKEIIQFVAVSDADTSRGLGCDVSRGEYQSLNKTPVKLNIQLKSHKLIGQAFQLKNKTLKSILNDNSLFLPLVDVLILCGSQLVGTRPFVMVNKRQIISIKKDLIV